MICANAAFWSLHSRQIKLEKEYGVGIYIYICYTRSLATRTETIELLPHIDKFQLPLSLLLISHKKKRERKTMKTQTILFVKIQVLKLERFHWLDTIKINKYNNRHFLSSYRQHHLSHHFHVSFMFGVFSFFFFFLNRRTLCCSLIKRTGQFTRWVLFISFYSVVHCCLLRIVCAFVYTV